MKKKLLLITINLITLSLFSQNNIWEQKQETQLTRKTKTLERVIVPNNYEVYSLDMDKLSQAVNKVPKRISKGKINSNIFIDFPFNNGKMESFRILSTDVMHPDLAAKYPQIKTYTGQSVENPLNKIHFTITPSGFRGVITGKKTIYIDPYAKGERSNYIVYNRKEYNRSPDDEWRCYAEDLPEVVEDQFAGLAGIQKNIQDGKLRRYDIAIACTSEYTAYHNDNNAGNGDAKADALAAMVVTVARVNTVYERDLAVTFQLVANNDLLIYENGFSIGNDPEPYDNYSGGQMLNVNTANISGLIGAGVYDIGHVFSTGGGGIAGTSPCATNSKGNGVTGIVTPEFDPFDIDYVSHEIGHQYGAGHTYYNACFGSKVGDDYEPGSASTILGYAGICTPNVQDNSDGYFHARSIEQMSASILGDNCETEITISNNAPTANAGANYTIPRATPFVLDGSNSSDPNSGDVLTYCWEQYDNDGTFTQPPLASNAGGPIFRSNFPVTEATRTLPNLEAVINNETPTWEVLPNVARQLDFRLTVRDNNALGGQTDNDNTVITVSGTAGPFLVANPNTGSEIWYVGATENITWNVNNTNTLSANVNILLSTDGGYTYPITLASGTANDGSQNITVPNNIGTTNRIKIEAATNIFFDLSNQNFEIKAGTFELTALEPIVSVCQPADAIFNLNYEPAPGFTENVTFSVLNNPMGTTVSFSPVSLNASGAVTMTVSNTGSIAVGNYPITVQGQSTSATETYDVSLNVFDNNIGEVTLMNPINGATNQSSAVLLEWEALESANEYDVEVSTSPDFASISESNTVLNTLSYQTTTLSPGTIYYWRVKPVNTCLSGSFGDIFIFQTANDVCNLYDNEYFENNDFTWETNSNNAVSARVDIPDNIIVTDVSYYMRATHNDVGDIKMQFSSPSGLFAEVYNRDCANGSNFDATFTDVGSLLSCSGTPRVSGNVLPSQAFTRFDGSNAQGTWVLLATDRTAGSGGGTFNEFSVTVCGELQIVNDITIVNNAGVTVTQGESIPVTIPELAVSQPGAVDADLNYIITTVPENGSIVLNGVIMSVGDKFTQADITNNLLSYTNNGVNTDPDSFTYAIEGNNNAILGGQIFNITVEASTLGINTFENLSFSIFPNPNNGNFKVAFDKEINDAKVQLYDIRGRLVYNITENTSNNVLEINTTLLYEGFYILRLHTDGFQVDRKLIIKH